MNRLLLIFVAVLGAATKGGLHQELGKAVFDALSEFLTDVPGHSVALFEQNVRSILDADCR